MLKLSGKLRVKIAIRIVNPLHGTTHSNLNLSFENKTFKGIYN